MCSQEEKEAVQGDRVEEKQPISKERVNLEPTVLLEEGWPGITKSPLVFPIIV